MRSIKRMFRGFFLFRFVVNAFIVLCAFAIPTIILLLITGPQIEYLIVIGIALLVYYIVYLKYMDMVTYTFKHMRRDKLKYYAELISGHNYLEEPVYYKDIFLYESFAGTTAIQYNHIKKIVVYDSTEIDLNTGKSRNSTDKIKIVYYTDKEVSVTFKNKLERERVMNHLLQLKKRNEDIIVKIV